MTILTSIKTTSLNKNLSFIKIIIYHFALSILHFFYNFPANYFRLLLLVAILYLERHLVIHSKLRIVFAGRWCVSQANLKKKILTMFKLKCGFSESFSDNAVEI